MLTEFGEQIGCAFQLTDDILDVTSDTSDSARHRGPTCARECRRCRCCWPSSRTDPTDSRLLELLAGPISDDDHHAEALRLLRNNPAMKKARSEVRRRADSARALLEGVPDIAARDALVALCDLVTTRST